MTRVPLEARRVKLPSVKHDEVGQTAILMFVDMEVVPKKVYGTDEIDTKEDGTPKSQDLVTVLVMPGSTCVLSDPEGDEGSRLPPEAGTLAQIYYAGHRRWDYVQAKKAYKLDIFPGDILVDRFEGTTRTGTGGVKLSQDKKLHRIGVRAAKGEELGYVEQAERLFNERRASNRIVLSSAPAFADDVPTGPSDEEPF
jgi:hypothetical protein